MDARNWSHILKRFISLYVLWKVKICHTLCFKRCICSKLWVRGSVRHLNNTNGIHTYSCSESHYCITYSLREEEKKKVQMTQYFLRYFFLSIFHFILLFFGGVR